MGVREAVDTGEIFALAPTASRCLLSDPPAITATISLPRTRCRAKNPDEHGRVAEWLKAPDSKLKNDLCSLLFKVIYHHKIP
jgi:hypothetical protein